MPGFGRVGRPGKPLAIPVAMVILLIAGWVAFARLSAKLSDRYESFYRSLAEANKDGATARGWIPDDILPSSSRNIHEVHDLSPSKEWCDFEFDKDDSEKLRSRLRRIDVPPPSVRRIQDPKVEWWPTVLSGNLDAQEISKRGLSLYLIERPASSVMTETLVFAIDWSRGRGFFYATSRANQ